MRWGSKSAVRPHRITSTLSLTISSWIRRLPVSPDESVVPDDQLDLPARDRFSVLLYVEAGARDNLLACRCERSGHRHDHGRP